jgi:hypothetical protein
MRGKKMRERKEGKVKNEAKGSKEKGERGIVENGRE